MESASGWASVYSRMSQSLVIAGMEHEVLLHSKVNISVRHPKTDRLSHTYTSWNWHNQVIPPTNTLPQPIRWENCSSNSTKVPPIGHTVHKCDQKQRLLPGLQFRWRHFFLDWLLQNKQSDWHTWLWLLSAPTLHWNLLQMRRTPAKNALLLSSPWGINEEKNEKRLQ